MRIYSNGRLQSDGFDPCDFTKSDQIIIELFTVSQYSILVSPGGDKFVDML